MLYSNHISVRSLQAVTSLLVFTAISTTLTSTTSAALIAHWKLDEVVDATTAVDSTGNLHTGTKQGNASSGATGIIGNAWSFDGLQGDNTNQTTAGSYISVDTAPGTLTGLVDTFSISGWIKTAATSNATMFSISDNAVASEEVAFRMADGINASTSFGAADVLGRSTLPSKTAVSTTLVNDGGWRFLTFTQDSNSWDLYVDGVLEDSRGMGEGYASPFGIGANVVTIGGNDDNKYGAEWTMNGLIDDLAVWDNKLTSLEVSQLYVGGLAGIDAATAITAVVPEPSTVCLLLFSLLGLRMRSFRTLSVRSL